MKPSSRRDRAVQTQAPSHLREECSQRVVAASTPLRPAREPLASPPERISRSAPCARQRSPATSAYQSSDRILPANAISSSTYHATSALERMRAIGYCLKLSPYHEGR